MFEELRGLDGECEPAVEQGVPREGACPGFRDNVTWISMGDGTVLMGPGGYGGACVPAGRRTAR